MRNECSEAILTQEVFLEYVEAQFTNFAGYENKLSSHHLVEQIINIQREIES